MPASKSWPAKLAALVNIEERATCRRFVAQMRVPSHEARMLRDMSQPSDDREALQERRLTVLEAELGL